MYCAYGQLLLNTTFFEKISFFWLCSIAAAAAALVKWLIAATGEFHLYWKGQSHFSFKRPTLKDCNLSRVFSLFVKRFFFPENKLSSKRVVTLFWIDMIVCDACETHLSTSLMLLLMTYKNDPTFLLILTILRKIKCCHVSFATYLMCLKCLWDKRKVGERGDHNYFLTFLSHFMGLICLTPLCNEQ